MEAAPELIEGVLLVNINARLREPQDDREDELATALTGSVLMDVTSHFTTRQHYRGRENSAWQVGWEGRKVSGSGDYILVSDRDDFTKAGVWEARLHTDHWMVLAVI